MHCIALLLFVFVNIVNNKMSGFANLSDEEIKELLNDEDAKRTLKANEQCWRVYKRYCGEKGIHFNEQTANKYELKLPKKISSTYFTFIFQF